MKTIDISKETLYASKGVCPHCKSLNTYMIGRTRKSYCGKCKKTW